MKKTFTSSRSKVLRMREKVDPGNWELHLDGGTAKIKLIDDSSTASSVTVEQGGRVFNVVSGSITNGVKTLHQQKHQKVFMDYSIQIWVSYC